MSTPARSTRRTTRSAAWDGHGDEQPPVEGSVPPVARKQAKRNGGSGGSGPSGSPAYVLLALVLIAGGITYNRWAARQEAAAAARSAGDDAPHRSVLEQEAPGDAATPAPPLPKMTAEEIAIFEKVWAAWVPCAVLVPCFEVPADGLSTSPSSPFLRLPRSIMACRPATRCPSLLQRSCRRLSTMTR
jgi:hypothetical protein